MFFCFDAFEFKHYSGCWLKVNINDFGGNTNINCSMTLKLNLLMNR